GRLDRYELHPSNPAGQVLGVQCPVRAALCCQASVAMSVRAITGIISLCVATTGLFLANMFLPMMIGEINRKRQEGSLVSYFGFTFPKMLRIFGDYRSSYPKGSLHIYSVAAFVLAIIGL